MTPKNPQVKLPLLLFAVAFFAGCNWHSQDKTENTPTDQDGGTMTSGPNSLVSAGAATTKPVAPRKYYFGVSSLDWVREGKDVELSWSSKETPKGLTIHYTVKSVSDADVWILDRLWWSKGGSRGADDMGAYRFVRGGILRLLLGRAPGAQFHEVPHARLLRAHGTLEGEFTMGVAVAEYGPNNGHRANPTAFEHLHVERVVLMLQYILAGPDLTAEKSWLSPDALKLGLDAIWDAKMAVAERPLSVDVIRETGPFERITLPGEPGEDLPPGVTEPDEPPPTSPVANDPAFDDVEKYARLMAAYRAPAKDRAPYLAKMGLTRSALRQLRDHWCARFATGPGAAKLRVQFEKIYGPALVAEEAADEAAAKAKWAAEEAARKAASDRPAAPVDSESPAESPAAPVPAGPAGVRNVHLLPTFLQAPAPADNGLAAKAPISPSLPTPPGPPLMGETLELDPVAILAGISAKMPFDSRRPSAASVPSATPSKGREQSGQTLDLDPTALGALAAAAIAKGPPRGTPGAPGAATGTPAPAATPPRKRLVRFDPQTGTPLATPYWEDLPSTSDASTRKR